MNLSPKARIAVLSLPLSDEFTLVPDVSALAVQQALEQLDGQRLDLVLLPQYAVKESSDPAEQSKLELLYAFAGRNGCYIVFNSLRETDEGRRCVSTIIGRNGSFQGEYVKTHRLEGMDIELSLGDDLPVFALDFGRVALMAGSDLFIPEVAEMYSIKGAELLLCSLGTQVLRDDTEIHRQLKGRAVANYCFVAASAYASDQPMYMASNVSVMHANPAHIDVTGDASATFNAFGLGKHTGRAAAYDLRGETIASTGRESGYAVCELPMEKKRDASRYLFGIGCILTHQNERGVFRELGRPAVYDGKRYPVEKPVFGFVHIGYQQTILSRQDDWYVGILAQVEEAAKRSDIVVCSEYSRGDNGQAETVGLPEFLQGCSELARTYRCYVAVNEALQGMNTSLLFDRDGGLVHKHQKVNPLNMMYEKKLPAGDAIDVVETDFGRIGFMICADTYCQEIPRIHALKGAEIILIQSQSWGYDANAINEGFSRAWAIENCAFVVMSNFPTSQVAHRTNVIDPTGETVFATNYDRAGLYTFQLDLEAVRRKPSYMLEDGIVRQDFTYRSRIMHARRPELYGLLTGSAEEARL
ncbi:carbon-nitrogen hydrolase family protein [Paenibacillus sp. HJGM_3]|uniref:carbon-nitrogen hydrolase family protein n=1 Tax=Paenibacillus sp. HJGM_3 TaxID=3379816 RepID=UPI00385F5E21